MNDLKLVVKTLKNYKHEYLYIYIYAHKIIFFYFDRYFINLPFSGESEFVVFN